MRKTQAEDWEWEGVESPAAAAQEEMRQGKAARDEGCPVVEEESRWEGRGNQAKEGGNVLEKKDKAPSNLQRPGSKAQSPA